MPLLVLLAIAAPALAQLPEAQVGALFPPGGQVGASVDVKITAGKDLEGLHALLFSHPGITAVPHNTDPLDVVVTPHTLPFKVTIAPGVPSGLYEARAVTSHGVSNACIFVVDDLPQTNEIPDNHTMEAAQAIELGSVVNGTVEPQKIDFFKFEAKAGQRILIDCQAKRIDSQINATVAVFDTQNQQVKQGRATLELDPVIDFVAAADGVHTVKVQDVVFAGGPEHFYRLAVSTRPHVDFIFPPAGVPGTRGPYTLYGRNLPDSSSAPDVMIQGSVLEKLDVWIDVPQVLHQHPSPQVLMASPAGSSVDAMPYRLQTPQGWSNAVLLGHATAPVVVEAEPNDEPGAAQQVTAPCEVAGRFATVDGAPDSDWFGFEAKQGQTVCVDVYSHRLGLPTDPFLLVKRAVEVAEGQVEHREIAAADGPPGRRWEIGDDVITSDPSCCFEAPADGKYVVKVQDNATSPRFDLFYRLAIRAPQPDFRLVARPHPANTPRSLVLRQGGADALEVLAYRQDGFDGPIDLRCQFLPPGVIAQDTTIPAGGNGAVIILHAAEDARAWVGALRVLGTARIGQTLVTREARSAHAPWNKAMASRATGQTILCVVSGWKLPVHVRRAEPKVIGTARGGTVNVPLKLERRDGFGADVVVKVEPLPRHLQQTPPTFSGDATEASISFKFNNNVTPGLYNLVLQVEADVSFARNGEAVSALKVKQQNEWIEASAAAAAKHAAAAVEAGAARLKEVEEALKAAQDTNTKAETAVKESETQLAEAKTKLEEAQKAAVEAPGDEAAASALSAAEQAAADAGLKHVTAQKAKAEAAKAVEEVQKQQKAAAEAKKKVDGEAGRTKGISEAATKAREAAEAFSKVAASFANMKMKTRFEVVPIEVRLAPVTIKVASPEPVLKQSAQIEVPVKIERLFGYAEDTPLTLIVPPHVSGLELSPSPLVIPKDKTEGTLTIKATADATPGTHQLKVDARMKFGDQDVGLGEPFWITVEENGGS